MNTNRWLDDALIDARLTDGERIFCAQLWRIADHNKGEFYHSQKKLAFEACCGERTVRRYLRRLVGLGLLRKAGKHIYAGNKHGGTIRYRFAFAPKIEDRRKPTATRTQQPASMVAGSTPGQMDTDTRPTGDTYPASQVADNQDPEICIYKSGGQNAENVTEDATTTRPEPKPDPEACKENRSRLADELRALRGPTPVSEATRKAEQEWSRLGVDLHLEHPDWDCERINRERGPRPGLRMKRRAPSARTRSERVAALALRRFLEGAPILAPPQRDLFDDYFALNRWNRLH